MQSQNEDGVSRWSDEVNYSTTADRPSAPSRPVVKGRVHAHSFRVRWDPPTDNGGSSITNYELELDSGSGFVSVWNGLEAEFVCDKLTPGAAYQVRVCCSNSKERSEFSETLSVVTEPVFPGQCAPPRLVGKARSTTLQLKWGKMT